jgi:hypothetical protein
MTKFCRHFKNEWLYPKSRFWRWQVYHTPHGIATSNNPLEQFHAPLKKSLKLNKNTTVFGLVEAMEKGVQLCINAERYVFVNECEVSARMFNRYKRLKALGLLTAAREDGEGNPSFRIQQVTFEDAISRFQEAGDDKAKTDLLKLGEKLKHKHECLNQPALGWLVNSVRRVCQCDLWFKHGVCIHVIHACTVDRKECPGLKKPKRLFVNPIRPRRVRPRLAAPAPFRPPSPDI